MATEEPPTPVPSLPRRIKKAVLLTIAVVAWSASTGAAVPENGSQIQLMAYSFGSALALIVGIRIAIRLFAYIVRTLVVLAIIGIVYTLAKLLANLLGL